MTEEEISLRLLEVGAVSIKDVDAGEEPFLYSSGNFGPGYVMVKSTVAKQKVFKPIVEQLALRLIDDEVEFDHIAGNATGGMVPAYECREAYQRLTGRDDIEYVYVRGSRKEGGHRELITGLEHIEPTREDGSPVRWVVVEELVNFGETTTNSLGLLRDLGYMANQGATILHYDHPEANARLAKDRVKLTHLVKLPNFLDVAVDNGFYSADAAASYREFLVSPAEWQKARGIEPLEK